MKVTLLLLIIAILANIYNCALIEVMCDVNGFAVPAAVDTGSEVTIMSASCARRCQILHHVDTKLSGKVKGINGIGEVIGAVRKQNFGIGPVRFGHKLEVLRDSHRDLIIGLDVLERFDGVVNLKSKTIKLNVNGKDVNVPLMNHRSSLPSQPVSAAVPTMSLHGLSGGFRESEDEYEQEEDEGLGWTEERVSMEGV